MVDIKGEYYVDEVEYFNLARKGVGDATIWNLHKSLIHKKLNYLFDSHNFLLRLVFDYSYSELLTSKKNNYGVIGDFHGIDFDHTLSIRLIEKESIKIDYKDTITGVLTFPYLNWEQVKQWIDKTPKGWESYIINPHLLSYNAGAVGLFLTPSYGEGIVINNFNKYCIKLTGYPFFLKYSTDIVPPIEKINLNLNRENFVEEYKQKSNCREDLSIFLDFWANNPSIKCECIDEAYLKYLDVQEYTTWRSINFMEITSELPFSLVHEDTGTVLGTYHRFSLDKKFNIIDTEKGEQKLTDEETNDLLNGKYNYKIINIQTDIK